MLQSSLILYIVFKTRILPKSAVYFPCQNREILAGRVTLVESFRPNSHTHTHTTHITHVHVRSIAGVVYAIIIMIRL